MKQGRIIGIIFAIVNIILIIICAVLYLRMDRTAPEIEFYASEAVYMEGEETSGLLLCVRAYDSVDGDITDRIVIEKIIEDRQADSVVVYYAVSDKAGNAAKASRVFPALWAGEEDKDDDPARFMEAGIDAEFSQNETDDGREQMPEQTPTPVAFPTGTPQPTPESTPEPTPESTPTPIPKPRPTTDLSVPVLTLKVSEVKVNAGQGPAWVDVIATLTDDKDSYETLFKNLSVSKYDKNKSGTYQVTVYTEDSDGNRSESVPLTIVVK